MISVNEITNVFEVAQFANNRLNDGAEGKFPVTLAIVSEMARYRGNVKSLKDDMNIIGDGIIAPLINTLDDENELRMLENVRNFLLLEDLLELMERLVELAKVIQDDLRG